MNQNKGINLENLKDFKKNVDGVITEALSDKLDKSDIADWAKSDTKPKYTHDEVGADSKGSAQNALQSAKDYVKEQIALLVNGAPDTLDTLKEIADAMLENEDVIQALQSAVGNKANSSDLTAHINNKNNPHGVSKSDIGLSNVENKSSATIRGELTKTNVTTALGFTPPTTDTKYTLPTASASALGGIKSGGNITVGSDGAVTVNSVNGKTVGVNVPANAKFTDTTYTLPKASTSTLGGVKVDGNTISINNDGVISVNTTVIPSLPQLKECTPSQIKQMAQAGTAPNYWAVGDRVAIKLNGTVGNFTFHNEMCYIFIIGFNHNSSIEGNNSIHFQFGKTANNIDIAIFTSTPSSYFAMNNISNSTNTGGWKDSTMRNIRCPEFIAVMPEEWQNIITSCTKYSDNTGGGNDNASHVTATSDKIWLLSEFEVFGIREYANSTEKNYQKQYDYYKNGNSKIKYNISEKSFAISWFLRSPASNNNNMFCAVRQGGLASMITAYTSCGMSPCFKVS